MFFTIMIVATALFNAPNATTVPQTASNATLVQAPMRNEASLDVTYRPNGNADVRITVTGDAGTAAYTLRKASNNQLIASGSFAIPSEFVIENVVPETYILSLTIGGNTETFELDI